MRTGAVGRALPVVEVVEHRRAVRDGAQQCAELAEHVRTDRVSLIRHEIVPHAGALAGEDVEMIEPEVSQYFVELPFADERARHAR